MSSAHTHVVPASPSWYCSQVLDCSPAGIACYGAKNTVFVWDVERDPPVCLAHFSAHQDRVVGLSLSPSTNQLQCCTAGEDGRVRVWNIEDGSMLKEHNIHAENHKKPTCVQWSPLVSDLIISGDDRGTVVLWWTETDQQRSLLPENAHIFCLACSPHDPNLLAIGYRTGAVVIIDMSKKTQMTVQRLKGHDEEIHSICWCPVPGEIIPKESAENEKDPTPTTGCLLATGSRDRTIRVWSFTRGRPVHVMKLPTNTGYSRGRYDDQSKNRAWVTILWLKNEPYKLLSSSFNGELIQWDLSQPKPQWKLFTAGDKALGHNRIVFNMAAGGSDSKILVSSSMDRNIVTWDLDTLKSKRSIPTLGGFVYCMAHSPFQPGCVALGVGDNMIRIWKTDHPDNSLSIQSHWQGIRSKVTALAWHPKKEGKLAYGTDDGRVGIMDTLSHKSPLISSSYHKHTVYVVAWGPVCSEEAESDSLALFSCGDGAVLQHLPWNLEKEASNIAPIIAKANNVQGKMPGRSEISWKPDLSVVALGNEDGSIDVYQGKTLLHLASIQVHHKLVNCVRWHPAFTAQSPGGSPFTHWLASGSNEAVISVVNLAAVFEKHEKEGSKSAASVITESYVQLEGHTNRITSLSWSSHQDGLLASASYDGSSEIWDAKSNRGVANFRTDHGRFLCVAFSDVDPDLVYLGGDRASLFVWRPSEQRHKMPPAGRDKKKKKKKAVKIADDPKTFWNKQPAAGAMGQGDVTSNSFDEELAQLKGILERKKELSDKKAEEEKKSEEQKPPSKPDTKPKRKAKSLFPNSSVMDNRGKVATQEDCVLLTQAIYSGNKDLLKDQFHLGCFFGRRESQSLLTKEIDHHANNGNLEHQITLQMMKGNLVGLLEEAASKKQLNDSLMALAPMASPQTWREFSVKYAAQLEEEGSYMKASSHLLAANKISDAINLLCRNGQYKEALCLAQARLSPMDPLLKSVCLQWSYHLAKDGNMELAAKCYLAVKEPLEAAKVLAKRADLPSTQTAIRVCLAAGQIACAKNYAKKCVQQMLMTGDLAGAEAICMIDAEFKYLELYVCMHQALAQQLHEMGWLDETDVASYNWMKEKELKDEDKVPILLLNKEDTDKYASWDVCCLEGCHFVVKLVRQFFCQGRIQLAVDPLNNLVHDLEDFKLSQQNQKALPEVSLLVTMGIVYLLQGNSDECCVNWSQALSVCNDGDNLPLAANLCQILLPTGPTGITRLQAQLLALRISTGVKLEEPLSLLSNHELLPKDCVEEAHDLSVASTGVSCDAKSCTPGDCLIASYSIIAVKSCRAPADFGALSRSLLWDLHATRVACNEALTRISCATASMINSHVRTSTPTFSFSEEFTADANVELGVKTDAEAKAPLDAEAKAPLDAEAKAPLDAEAKAPLDAEAKAPLDAEAKAPLDAEAKAPLDVDVDDALLKERQRQQSGECVPMAGIPGMVVPLKPHQQIPKSPLRSSDLEPLRARRVSSETSCEDDYETMYEENPVCSELCQIFEKKEEEAKVWNLSLPVDLHYQMESVPLVWLAEEQLQIRTWLGRVELPKNCPFPNPILSAMTLLPYLSKYEPSLMRPVHEWASKHAYLQEQIKELSCFVLPKEEESK